MAVRLSVVMIHSTPATPIAERVAQGVVGELIGLSGIDLILVAPLDSLSETSTDRLTLSSLDGDIAVLDWKSQPSVYESLKRLGVGGARTRHASDAAIAVDAGDVEVQPRKLYLFNLLEFNTAEGVVSCLKKLNESRSVRTFSLAPIAKDSGVGETADFRGSGVVSGAPAGLPASGTSDSSADNRHAEHAFSEQAVAKHSHGNPASGKQLAKSEQEVSKGTAGSEPDGQDLDALIDQLDQLDP